MAGEPKLYGSVLIVDAGTLSESGITVSSTEEPSLRAAALVLDAGTLTETGITVSSTLEPVLYGATAILDAGTLSETGITVSSTAEPSLYAAALIIEMGPQPIIPDNEPMLYGAGLLLDAGTLAYQEKERPVLYGAAFIVDVEVRGYDDRNRKRVAATWAETWGKRSDLRQVLDNQWWTRTRFGLDHSTTTGKHTPALFTSWVDGAALGTSSVTGLANTVDATSRQDELTVADDRRHYSFETAPLTTAPPVRPILALCKGATASGGEVEAVASWRGRGAGTNGTIMATRYIRRSTGSGASNWTGLSVTIDQFPGLKWGSRDVVETVSSPGSVIPWLDYAVTAAAAFTRNLYDRLFENVRSVKEAMEYRHAPATWASDPIALDEFRGAASGVYGNPEIDNSTTYNKLLIGPHGGSPLAVIPAACSSSDNSTPPASDTSEEHCIAPAFDDTNAYLVDWLAPGVSRSGADKIWIGWATIPLDDLAADATLSGSWDDSHSIAQGDAMDVDAIGPMAVNDAILQALWETEHERTTGRHQISLDSVTGYSLVRESYSFSASGSVGGVVTVDIEAWSGSRIYLAGVVMAAGGHTVMVTLGGDETTAKVFLRTIELGSATDGEVTVVRLTRS